MKKVNKYEEIQMFSMSDVTVHQQNRSYDGFFNIEQYEISHALFNGAYSDKFTREIFERGDAVVVVPYDPITDCVVLLEQFRAGAIGKADTPWLLEFVAGMFDANESAVDVAIREAKEEANLTILPSDLVEIMQYFSSPGGMSERIHLYIANVSSNNVAGVYGLAEEHEDIRVHVLPREDVFQLFLNGKITNAASVIGVQWLQMNYKALQEKWNNNG